MIPTKIRQTRFATLKQAAFAAILFAEIATAGVLIAKPAADASPGAKWFSDVNKPRIPRPSSFMSNDIKEFTKPETHWVPKSSGAWDVSCDLKKDKEAILFNYSREQNEVNKDSQRPWGKLYTADKNCQITLPDKKVLRLTKMFLHPMAKGGEEKGFVLQNGSWQHDPALKTGKRAFGGRGCAFRAEYVQEGKIGRIHWSIPMERGSGSSMGTVTTGSDNNSGFVEWPLRCCLSGISFQSVATLSLLENETIVVPAKAGNVVSGKWGRLQFCGIKENVKQIKTSFKSSFKGAFSQGQSAEIKRAAVFLQDIGPSEIASTEAHYADGKTQTLKEHFTGRSQGVVFSLEGASEIKEFRIKLRRTYARVLFTFPPLPALEKGAKPVGNRFDFRVCPVSKGEKMKAYAVQEVLTKGLAMEWQLPWSQSKAEIVNRGQTLRELLVEYLKLNNISPADVEVDSKNNVIRKKGKNF